MTDRELLEMAAKAAGYEVEWVRNSGCHYRCEAEESREQWCPLDDDGDALRLAVKLKLDVCFYDGYAEVQAGGDGIASASIEADSGRMPLRAANTLPQYWVCPSYTHSKLSCIGTLRLGTHKSLPRRYLPFHECVYSCASRSVKPVFSFHPVK